MNGDAILTIVLIVPWVYGFCLGWKRLTNLDGNNFFGGRLPQKFKDRLNKSFSWLNEKRALPIVIKIVISVALSVVFVAIQIIVWLLRFFAWLSRR